jgi:beta-mannosidase
MLRGGAYEDERFTICATVWIPVWQEFIFSCSIYPLGDPDFLDNVRIEAIENIRRLRHRASLALWCGNNEMEWGWVDWHWKDLGQDDLQAAYDQFFHHTLPAWCHQEDPDRSYWPSSPSSDTPFVNPNGQRQGDAHFWDVWHGGKPFTAYRHQFPRFMSEFGFQALPPLETIRSFANEPDWNMTSYIMEQHQKNASGNVMMVRQMLDMFRLPRSFESLVYLSMVLQAEGIRYGVEHWRRHPNQVAGTLYWQLNDCWRLPPGRASIILGAGSAALCCSAVLCSGDAFHEDNPPTHSVYVTNDLLSNWEGQVIWSLETFDAQVLDSGAAPVHVAPQSATNVCDLDFATLVAGDNLRRLVFIAELANRELDFPPDSFFAPIKHLALVDPAIRASLREEAGTLHIDLVSSSLALLVEVSLAGCDTVFSDNYFNLPAGREVNLSCPLPAGWTLNKAKKALSIRSVIDTY